MQIISALERLAIRLPGDTPDREDGEYGLDNVQNFIHHDEPELALNAILHVASAHQSNGTPLNNEFWADARILCDKINGQVLSTYSDVMSECDDILNQFLNS